MSTGSISAQPIPRPTLYRLAIMAFFTGMLLGQSIDFAYPISDALHYEKFAWKYGSLEFCWFIDILYGVAGVILWLGAVLWDRHTGQKPVGGSNPSWGFAITGCVYFIALFYIAPYMSGIMKLPNSLIFLFTMSTGVLSWWMFDRTKGGIYMMLTAGILGPLAEIFMINVLDIYYYTRPDVLGIPLWFIGAYICGCAPCANLARKYLSHLESKSAASSFSEQAIS